MQIDHLQEQCHYAPCTCRVEPGERYCSDYCRDAAESSAPEARGAEITRLDRCGCDHAECTPR
jgi:hypothetical protein